MERGTKTAEKAWTVATVLIFLIMALGFVAVSGLV
jgi:hypothetical protein